MRSIVKNIFALSTSLVLAFGSMALLLPLPVAQAAASLSVSAPSSVTVGENVTVTVNVNTGGSSANSFQFTLSYSGGLFEGVRGSYAGSICSLPISQPDPSGGSASGTCGTPSGYTGSGLVATIVLKATSAGSGSLSLSGCQVLANDGHGTDITGGCSGRSITVSEPVLATPTPAGSTGTAATATPKVTPKATVTPKPTPTPIVSQSAKPAETPKPNSTPAATEVPTAPPVQALQSTPTPSNGKSSQASTSPTPAAEKKSVISSLRNVFSSFGDIKSMTKDTTGLAALMIGMVPFLSLTLAIVFFTYRLYLLERRRKRTLDRLFEMELGELASLEGKLDLLAEKGAKGREQYREEFQHAKENILRQLKPNYNKPIEPEKAAAKTEEKPAPEEKK